MLRLALAPALAAALLVPAAACKKESPSGLPPAKDWNAAAEPGTAPGSADPHGGAAPGNPHAGMTITPDNPHAGMGGMAPGNPHGGMGAPGGGGGPVAEQTQPRTLEKLAGGRLALGPFSAAVP
ncbi:MAG TPA: hypothetical protein VN253_15920, partial [Kofleriaceae bacterium]|nr:hypothetical protein [Kofleriaceae bacterium]